MRQCVHCRTHHNMLGAFCSEQCHDKYFFSDEPFTEADALLSSEIDPFFNPASLDQEDSDQDDIPF